MKFLKNSSNDKLLKNSKNNQKNEKSSIKIFDENENEKNKNVEAQNFRKQSIFDVSKNPKLVENNLFDPNRENRESHVTSTNQRTKK